ncbi:aquaporin [Candidatus Saccharibacteria bacterium]|nr:aquaporin [Candidatus Saccharibacteria bacterium]
MAKSKKSGKKTKTTPSVKEEKISEKDKKVDNKKSDKVKAETKEVKEVKAEKETKETKEAKEEKTEKVEEKKTIASKEKTGFWHKFFAKKYDTNENILTIFKDKKVYGALIGEVIGTLFITMIILTLGLYQLLYLFLILTVVYIAIRKLSGANLNPVITVGMMATRRMSVIRGVLYLLAQVVGAWLGLTLVSVFLNTSGSESELPGMTATPDGKFWVISMLEFTGAAIIGFFYARSQAFKKNSAAFGLVAAGGTLIALITVYIITANFFGLDGTFMLNPAIALMYQIQPQSANGVGELLGGIGLALCTYVIFPMVGGVIGFYLSDVSETLIEE